MSKTRSWSYARAGVNIDRGNALVQKIKSLSGKSRVPGVLGSIGGFSGFFDFSHLKIRSPLLVGTTDGVGTKLEVAQALGKHDTVGIDLVAMCVNDLLCTGARPLFFLDYFACGKLHLSLAQAVLKGIVQGCREAGCALIGGETAEMPGFYRGKSYDLAGFAVGMVDKTKVITGKNIREGDILIGLASSGFHSNGFSLLRKLFSKKELRGAWGRKLLTPTRIYVKPVLTLARKIPIKGVAHITGGAFVDKIPRIIPGGLCAEIHLGSWPVAPVFSEVRRRGRIGKHEMFRTFNMGIGMVLVISPREVRAARRELTQAGLNHWAIGSITKSRPAGKKVVLREV